jgi:hypothetical protein
VIVPPFELRASWVIWIEVEFWNMLGQRVQEELVKKIPDLKWSSLEVFFFDSLRELEEAAFLAEEL